MLTQWLPHKFWADFFAIRPDAFNRLLIILSITCKCQFPRSNLRILRTQDCNTPRTCIKLRRNRPSCITKTAKVGFSLLIAKKSKTFCLYNLNVILTSTFFQNRQSGNFVKNFHSRQI